MPGAVVTALSLKFLQGGGTDGGQFVAGEGWPYAAVVALDDALDLLVSVLDEERSHALSSATKATDLRPKMARRDARFIGNAESTGTAGMMTTLIGVAEARGLIQVNRELLRDNAFIWLNGGVAIPTASSTISVTPAIPLQPNVPVHTQAEAATTLTVAEADGEPSRSQALEQVLKHCGLSPYAKARAALYDELSSLVRSTQDLPLDELVSRAAEQAEKRLPKEPWRKAVGVVRKLVLRAGVALDDNGVVIKPGWRSAQARVATFSDEWQGRLDAELLLALVHGATDITEDDIDDLAGMLYHDRIHVGRQKVWKAVGHLLDSGRAVEVVDGDRTFLRPAEVEGPPEGIIPLPIASASGVAPAIAVPQDRNAAPSAAL